MAVTIGITGVDIASQGDTITAADIRTTLETETALYTNVRKQRAILNVTGGGGNTGSRPTAGVVFDQTQIAHLRTSVRQSLGSIASTDITSGDVVDDTLSTLKSEGMVYSGFGFASLTALILSAISFGNTPA